MILLSTGIDVDGSYCSICDGIASEQSQFRTQGIRKIVDEPSTDPCGTPDMTGAQADSSPSISTF